MSAHYTGELDLRFLRHGKGEYKYPNSIFRFSGEWKLGTKNGHGVFAVEGGSTFEGNFVNGEIEGRGSKQWADGRCYEGDFSRGEASGEGRFTSPSGESYVGTWAQNKRHGKGFLMLPNGQGTYAGEFHRHRYHGEGELTLASGFRYSGVFADGLPNGLGAAVYPGGSKFNGPYEAGRKNGPGGNYVCGITGICWVGAWAAGNAVSPPSKWSIEPDSAEETFGAGGGGGGQAKTTKPGAKADKGGGGKKGGKASKKGVEEPDDGGAEKPVVAAFDGDGAVAGLWCRCVRDVQEKPEPPPVPSELQEDAEAARLAKEREREVVSDESGRTLAVTLHEVTESAPVGAPIPFFVRRPNATDVSELLGRFPIDGLAALFQLNEQSYPKATASGGRKLVIVPGAKSAARTSIEQADLDPPPAKDSKAAASKGKGGKKGESEQPRPGDGEGIDERWKSIRSEVQSNRCLVIGAGENFSLATPPLSRDLVTPGVEGEGGRKPSVQSAEVNAGSCAGSAEHEEINTEMGCALGTAQADDGGFIADGSPVMVGLSSPFAVCLDFRIDLVEALLNTEGVRTTSEENLPTNGTIVVRILSCGNDVEVSAAIRLWAPPDVPAVRDDERDAGATLNSGEASGVESLSTGSRSRGEARASTTLLSRPSGDGDATALPTPTWYLHALTVRSGSFTGAVRCMHPGESALKSSPSETFAVCDLAEWHALALISNKDRGDAPVSLCIDGDVVALQQDMVDVAKAGTGPGEVELLASGAVVVGGTGGEWTALAVKNLAVYNTGLGTEQLLPSTRVFRAWREEQQEARAADAEEDERWLEEARKAEEEGREPDEREEWLVGADSVKELRTETVRGEARIDRIMLPKAAQEGGQWILRVEDVSHGVGDEEVGSAGRPRGLCSSMSVASEVEAEAAAAPTDEELQAFLPLPTETVKLERA